VIGGGGLKIYLTKMEAILKWPNPTNFIEVRIFVREEQYLQNYIASFSTMATPFHVLIASDKIF
jgi:hypothetical protein